MARAPREIIQFLFDHDKALEVAQSIATRGYFPNEPLLAIKENEQIIVVEGNRRLAALKALREPGLLEGPTQRRLERLARTLRGTDSIDQVPVTLAPSRKATDRQIAGRHIGTPVRAWQAENRASFILEKLEEGYDNDELRDDLGFSVADIQQARQTRAIADIARSLELPDEVRAKLENPRAKIFTTIERVVDSTVGRERLMIVPDPAHGIRGTTTQGEFIKGFTRLVTDVALKRRTSRSLNSNDDIRDYFDTWDKGDLPVKKKGEFVASDVIKGESTASPIPKPPSPTPPQRTKAIFPSVLPTTLKVRYGSERVADIRNELVKLKRDAQPNAGAVLLRVFLELVAVDFLKRTGKLDTVLDKLGGKGKFPYEVPPMKNLIQSLNEIAKANLSASESSKVEKALRPDKAAPFTLGDLHSFVHQAADLPTDRDILQFWLRTEPLFRLMLETDPSVIKL